MTTRDYTDSRTFESGVGDVDNEYTDSGDFEERPEDTTISGKKQQINEMWALMPWMPRRLVRMYVEEFIEHGDTELAWARVQASDEYEMFFPGNRRRDGTLRYTEMQYAQVIENFEQTISNVGVNPRLFRDQFGELIRGGVDPTEFGQRVSAVTERVRFASEDIQAQYRDLWGFEITNAGLIASVMDPQGLGQEILNRRITMAEIGGEAAESGFDLRRGFIDQLFDADMSKVQADALFGEAANVLPALQVLASRHADPDDDFDIYEFSNAMVFDDPFQRRRMRRLFNQERASFQEGGSFTVARDQAGGLAGLEAR
jgi:hypothetical protein